MALTKLPGFTLDSTANFTFANVTVSGNLTSGNANLGNAVTANYFLGNGSQLSGITASTATTAGTVTTNAQPNITSVGTLTSLTITGNITSGNANLGNLVTANYFTGNGSLLTGITASSANTAATVTTNAQPNITSTGTLSSLTVTGVVTATSGGVKVGNIQDPSGTNTIQLSSGSIIVTGNITAGGGGSGNVTATYFIGNGSQLTGLPASYSNTNVAAYLPTYTGNVAGNYFIGNGSTLTYITGANVTGYVPLSTAANTAGTVTTAAQPNITSTGTLASLTVTGNVTSGNANLGNAVTANYFIGNGSLLTGLPASYSNTNVAAYLPTYTGNFTAGNANVTGNVTAGNLSTSGSGGNISGANYIIANYFSGNGSTLTYITGANVTGYVPLSTAANTAGTVTTGAQPNITSTGTLTSVTVSGDATIAGNLTVSGSYTYANVTSFNVKDPIIEQGGNPNGTPLSSNDGKDRGQILHYYSSAAIDAFMGWDNSNAEFAFGSNVSVSSEVVTFNNFGNLRAGYYLGNGSQLTSLTGSSVSGNVTSAVQSHYANIANSVAGGNVSGQVGNALIAGTVYTNAQPNITSVGTLSSLTVTANISSGNANLGNLATSNYFSGDGSLLSSITGSNVSGNVTSAVQSHYANIANSVAGGNVSGQVGNSLVAGTVYTNAQPNITSVGTLTSVTVTANATAGNIKTDNLLYSNGTAWSFGGTPGGSNTYVQFNDGSSFGGNAGLTFNKTTTTLTSNNFVATSTANLGAVGNITITGGTANYVLSTDGSGVLSWVAQSGGSSSTSITVDNFTGNGVQTTFTLSTTPTSINQVSVNYNGTSLLRSSYSLSGANVTFGSAPANNSLLEVTTTQGTSAGTGSFTTRTYTGTGSQTNFTVTSGTTVSSVLVSLSGVLQVPTTDYTISGTTLTFTTAPPNGVGIQIRELGVVVASGGSALTIKDEGSNLTTTATSIDFVGGGITATNVGSAVTVTVPTGTTRAQAMVMGIIFGG